ncbi:hypothetical protein GCM10023321_74790 [Pseudonocardia eucalypti]|uniref:Uncharacterized protein n=1 Tax=Pseudonocardia eucalypti TaxID=648755 RepID=A0ABP9R9R2_9PSEU|nr:hypothetical protein [Pseudonocardia eucalypti]
MEFADKLDALTELAEQFGTPCGDRLAPIPGESWRCVLPERHGDDGHLAEDGTAW